MRAGRHRSRNGWRDFEEVRPGGLGGGGCRRSRFGQLGLQFGNAVEARRFVNVVAVPSVRSGVTRHCSDYPGGRLRPAAAAQYVRNLIGAENRQRYLCD
jgi:hypothetical protein